MVHPHADLIDTLGGGTAVAKALPGVDREAVYKWKINGVPWRWRGPLAKLARQWKIKVPADFFDAPSAEDAA